MTITARYAGTCKVCGQRIRPGDQIEWAKGEGTQHDECAHPEKRAEREHRERREAEYQERLAKAERERAKDRVLVTASPNQIAAMTKDEAERVLSFHRNNPPTMDYMVEYGRSLREIGLAKVRIKELEETCHWLIQVPSGNPEPDFPEDLHTVVECGAPVTFNEYGSWRCEAGHEHVSVDDPNRSIYDAEQAFNERQEG